MRLDIQINVNFSTPLRVEYRNVADPGIAAALLQLKLNGAQIMETMDDVLAQLGRIKSGVNNLEAKVTAALAQIPDIPPEVQAKITQAFNEAKGIADDAEDGTDEGATPTPVV